MSTENEKLATESALHKSKTVSKKELNDLQNILSQAMDNYKKNGGKRNIIKFYDQSGQSRRVNIKKKITTIKKRRFIPYGMEEQDIIERSANRRKKTRDNRIDDDGYDVDQYTQSSDMSKNNMSSEASEIIREEEEEENEEEENQQNRYRPRTLREKMDAVEELLSKMEGDLDEIEDYEFSDD